MQEVISKVGLVSYEVCWVVVVGIGVIGVSWVVYFLVCGLEVLVIDLMLEVESKLCVVVVCYWFSLELLGLVVGVLVECLCFLVLLEEVFEGVDFVQENGFECEDFKIDLFWCMDVVLLVYVVLVFSFLGLLMSKVQVVCCYFGWVVLGYFFNLLYLILLVEVIGGVQIVLEVVQVVLDFYIVIGKKVIYVCKEVKGYIVNCLQVVLWCEVFYLVEQGVVSIEDIDMVIVYGFGLCWVLMGFYFNLYMLGGEGGIGYMLDYLGLFIESWWVDLGVFFFIDVFKVQICVGVEEQMSGKIFVGIVVECDQLLVQLLVVKSKINVIF